MLSEKISYQIFFNLNKSTTIQIGKLGKYTFSAGKYIYTGSAKKNMDRRIQRHRNINKKSHWHKDYLLNGDECKIQKIIKSSLEECTLNQSTNGKIIVPGFGASDCRRDCISHLKYCD